MTFLYNQMVGKSNLKNVKKHSLTQAEQKIMVTSKWRKND